MKPLQIAAVLRWGHSSFSWRRAVLPALVRPLRNMIEQDIDREARRRASLELAQLDERMMRDIGITSGERDAEVRRLGF